MIGAVSPTELQALERLRRAYVEEDSVVAYGFTCETCDTRFDLRAMIAAKEAGLHPTCPACGAYAVRPVITAPLKLTSHQETAPQQMVGRSCGCGPGRTC